MTKKIKKEYYGKIIDISDDISIWADAHQYIIHYGKKYCYFDSLEHCFTDIFENKIKAHLIENTEKNIERIIEIHKETSIWLKSIFKSIENPRAPKD